MKEVRKRKRKLSIQKMFNVISFMFILACIIFYGTRFIKLYLANNKKEEIKVLADNIKDNNNDNDNFKNINGEYYFSGNENNNYLLYSNLLWRIISIKSDNTVSLTLDNSITALAKGNKDNFIESNLNYWLNDQKEEYTGILEKNLNNASDFLTYTNTCTDKIEDTKNITCKDVTKDIYITIPSLNDYVNTGGKDGFMNNEENYYLINTSKDNETWYVNNEGKISTSDGNDIIGIKPVITIKSTVKLINGSGSKEDPYVIEENNSLFGSYVKLDNDIWRIYDVDDEYVKLSLDGYLKINGEEEKYKYSNSSYYHNDTTSGSLAYYLKNTYLPSLNYKNNIDEIEYSNGIYSNTNNYDYKKVLSTKVSTKVSLLSIGDVILNPTNTNYYLSSGISKDSNLIYVMQNDFKVFTKVSSTSLKIVPTIAIKKDLLTTGSGTKEDPWEV